MRDKLIEYWYQSSLGLWTYLLLPFAWLFSIIIKLRRYAYQRGWLNVYRAPLPVIVVGNITIGGTGKTPFVIWLANFLQAQGLKPGIISRGFGGEYHDYAVVTKNSNVKAVGDEAVLIVKNTTCPMVVSKNRKLAIEKLLEPHQCDVIISDDGLQHYALARDIEIIIVDASREFGNQQLIPAGPLREPISRLKQADFVIENGGDASVNPFVMELQAQQLVSLINTNQKCELNEFADKTIHAVAGIGNPKRFFTILETAGINFIPHVFKDHYDFHANDIKFAENYPIIMTEKDAVKCLSFATPHCWYLPVSAKLTKEFATLLLAKLESLNVLKQQGVITSEEDFSHHSCLRFTNSELDRRS